MFHSFFQFPSEVRYLYFFSLSFNFTQWPAGTEKSTIWQILSFTFLFFFFWLSLCLIIWQRLGESLYLKIPEEFKRLILLERYWVVRIPFVRISISFSCTISWINLPTQSCRVLYSFWASLLHSLIMWLIVSSLSPHNLHLLFYKVLSILDLIYLVLMELFWADVIRDSVSLLRFLFFNYVLVFSCEMLLISRLKRP